MYMYKGYKNKIMDEYPINQRIVNPNTLFLHSQTHMNIKSYSEKEKWRRSNSATRNK